MVINFQRGGGGGVLQHPKNPPVSAPALLYDDYNDDFFPGCCQTQLLLDFMEEWDLCACDISFSDCIQTSRDDVQKALQSYLRKDIETHHISHNIVLPYYL